MGEPYRSDQLDALLAVVRDLLGEDLVAAYLHGSAVLGGLRPTSDLDVLVVSRRPTPPERRRALVAALLDLSVPPSRFDPARPEWRPIELTIVVASAIQPWRFPPAMDFQYGDWIRTDLERGVVAPGGAPNPDLAIVLALARRGTAALVGPPSTALLPAIPRADLVAAMTAGLDELLHDLAGDTRNVLLTLARIRMTLKTGEIGSKDKAAEWLDERLPPPDRRVLGRARELYLAGEYGPFEESEAAIRAVGERLVAEIAAPPRVRAPAAAGRGRGARRRDRAPGHQVGDRDLEPARAGRDLGPGVRPRPGADDRRWQPCRVREARARPAPPRGEGARRRADTVLVRRRLDLGRCGGDRGRHGPDPRYGGIGGRRARPRGCRSVVVVASLSDLVDRFHPNLGLID